MAYYIVNSTEKKPGRGIVKARSAKEATSLYAAGKYVPLPSPNRSLYDTNVRVLGHELVGKGEELWNAAFGPGATARGRARKSRSAKRGGVT